MATRRIGRDLLHRWERNPVITLMDVPFRCNTVFNGTPVKIDGEYYLILRIEGLEGYSFFALARSRDGLHFEVEPEPCMIPAEAGAWKVAVTHKDKTATETILAGNGLEELDEPRANLAAMTEFAAVTGGKAFGAEQAAALVQAIDLTPTRTVEKVVVTFWNLPLTMAALIGLVCLDCWLRKRRGMV